MSTREPIDPDTGQPVEPSTDEEAPEHFDEPGEVDAEPDRADTDLIMGEVLIEDDPASSTDR
ncbi:hypothetical protein ACFC1I_08155 [Microbacterium sp. NPDC056044]|uniref:hypothetical protein n=1 Tax=Microbacterium sp. NPDC056044 TaxID=3345690 RepID=UPI0035E1D6FA